jgi:hypothetical protein
MPAIGRIIEKAMRKDEIKDVVLPHRFFVRLSAFWVVVENLFAPGDGFVCQPKLIIEKTSDGPSESATCLPENPPLKHFQLQKLGKIFTIC